MLTEQDFFAIAEARPEMMRAFYKAVNAIIECRKEEATNPSGLWATARFKKKQFDANFLTRRFISGFVFNGQSLSEEEKKVVFNWIVGAATFHMLPKEEQDKVLPQFENDRADLADIEVVK